MSEERLAINPAFFYGPVVSCEFRGGPSKDRDTYRIRYTLTFHSGNKIKAQKGGFRTRKEAEAAQRFLVADVAAGRLIPFSFTVKEFSDYWLYSWCLNEKGIRYGTYTAYRNIIYRYLVPFWGPGRKLEDLAPRDILDAYLSIPSASIQKQTRGVLSGMFRMAAERKYTEGNLYEKARPLFPPVHAERKRDVRFTTEQVGTLLRLCRDNYRLMYLPLLLSLALGTRISETIAIRFDDIDFTARTVRVCRQLGRKATGETGEKGSGRTMQELETKTSHGIRTIPVPEWVLDEILIARAARMQGKPPATGRSDYLCSKEDGSPFHRSSFKKDFKALLRLAGFPESMHWHDLRHIYATVLKQNEVSMKAVSYYLGHATEDFTENVYVTQLDPVYDCSCLEAEWERIRPGNPRPADADPIPFGREDYPSLLQ